MKSCPSEDIHSEGRKIILAKWIQSIVGKFLVQPRSDWIFFYKG